MFERPASNQEIKLPIDEIFTYEPKIDRKEALEEIKNNSDFEENSKCEDEEEGKSLCNLQKKSNNLHLYQELIILLKVIRVPPNQKGMN